MFTHTLIILCTILLASQTIIALSVIYDGLKEYYLEIKGD